MKIYFRIPFTWYYLARTNGLQPSDGNKYLFCFAAKLWDEKGGFYYFAPVK